MRIAIPLLLALVTGCTFYGDVGEAADAAPADARAPDATPAGPVTFRLRYEYSGGAAPLVSSVCDGQLFVQATFDSGLQGFVAISDAAEQTVPALPDCTSCFCNDSERASACPDTPGQPVVTQLAFTDHIDWVWDGGSFPLQWNCAPGNHSCQAPVPAASGAYLARFCYATEADGVGPGHYIGTPICDYVPFEYPNPTGIVEHRVVCYGP
jgi:hypothetical protein